MRCDFVRATSRFAETQMARDWIALAALSSSLCLARASSCRASERRRLRSRSVSASDAFCRARRSSIPRQPFWSRAAAPSCPRRISAICRARSTAIESRTSRRILMASRPRRYFWIVRAASRRCVSSMANGSPRRRSTYEPSPYSRAWKAAHVHSSLLQPPAARAVCLACRSSDAAVGAGPNRAASARTAWLALLSS